MTSYESSQLFLEPQYNKSGMNGLTLAENPDGAEGEIQETFDVLNCSKEQLRQHTVAIQSRNRDLEAYAQMVAHDLKDPLAVMVMTSDLITGVPNLTHQELREYLQQVRSTAYEMNRIIDNLLLFADGCKVEAPLEIVDMAWVVANVRDRLSYMIKEYQAQVRFPRVWPDAIGYAPWIEEVWANYLSNALKHGGQPPRVEFGASVQPEGMVRFWTRDNGPGLPPDAWGSLFKPFGQIDRTGNAGHGLGLSIAHHIVEKLGGQVGVESELGKGSLFFFTLPAAPSSPE